MSLLCAFLKMIWWPHRLKVAVWRQVIYPVTLAFQPKWLFSSTEQLCFATFSHLKAFRFTQFEMDVRLRMEEELGQLQQEMKALQNLERHQPAGRAACWGKAAAEWRHWEEAAENHRSRWSSEAAERGRGGSKAEQSNLQKKLEEQDALVGRALQQIEDGFQKHLCEELKASQREPEDRMQRQLDEQKASFRKQLQTVSELWWARALQSAEKWRWMEQKMDNEEACEQKWLNKRETEKIRKSSSGVCGNRRSGDGNHKLGLHSLFCSPLIIYYNSQHALPSGLLLSWYVWKRSGCKQKRKVRSQIFWAFRGH